MKMRSLLLALWFAAGLASQDLAAPEGIPDWGDPCCTGGRTEGPPPTLEQILEGRGIQLTKQGLLSALLDLRAVVRSLAARKLAQDGQRLDPRDRCGAFGRRGSRHSGDHGNVVGIARGGAGLCRTAGHVQGQFPRGSQEVRRIGHAATA